LAPLCKAAKIEKIIFSLLQSHIYTHTHIRVSMSNTVMSSHDATLNLNDAMKKLAAATRVASAAIDNEKQAKKAVKLAHKLVKDAQKRELKQDKPVKSKTPTQIAYQLFGNDLRKNGDKISMKQQGELWKSADQTHWLLQVHAQNTRQNV
jgi:hypothetical protein